MALCSLRLQQPLGPRSLRVLPPPRQRPPTVLTETQWGKLRAISRFWGHVFNNRWQNRAGMALDDWQAEALFGAWQAALAYDPSKGIIFEAWVSLRSKRRCQRVIHCGLSTIARHEADWVHLDPLADPGDEDETAFDPPDETEPSLLLACGLRPADVHAAVRQLLPHHQAVIVWHYWRDETLATAGRLLGFSDSWAQKVHQQALGELRILLGLALRPEPKPKRDLPTHCAHGHEYTPENTGTDAKGARVCRACGRERTKKYRVARGYARRKPEKLA